MNQPHNTSPNTQPPQNYMESPNPGNGNHYEVPEDRVQAYEAQQQPRPPHHLRGNYQMKWEEHQAQQSRKKDVSARTAIKLITGAAFFMVGSFVTSYYTNNKMIDFDEQVSRNTRDDIMSRFSAGISDAGAGVTDAGIGGASISKAHAMAMIKSGDHPFARLVHNLGGKGALSSIAGLVSGAVGFMVGGLFAPKEKEAQPMSRDEYKPVGAMRQQQNQSHPQKSQPKRLQQTQVSEKQPPLNADIPLASVEKLPAKTGQQTMVDPKVGAKGTMGDAPKTNMQTDRHPNSTMDETAIKGADSSTGWTKKQTQSQQAVGTETTQSMAFA